LIIIGANDRNQVQLAFEELNAITTHDDNLEKQYKESESEHLTDNIIPLTFIYMYIYKAVDENVKLTMSLERARREIRVCKIVACINTIRFCCFKIAS